MVWRKERSPQQPPQTNHPQIMDDSAASSSSSTGSPSSSPVQPEQPVPQNGQPVSKRQRIDEQRNNPTQHHHLHHHHDNSSDESDHHSSDTTPPDLLVESPSSSSLLHHHHHHHHHPYHTIDEVDRSSSNNAQYPDLVNQTNHRDDVMEFHNYLAKQCLCGVDDHVLRRPFETHYKEDTNGTKRAAALTEWPTPKLIQFLSNLQELCDVYVRQSSKATVCRRIMDVCDALVRNEHMLVDEIIDLADVDNKYVQFLSGRVLASFLVMAKDAMDDDWVKKIVNQLFRFEHMDFQAVRKISFSLEIIKRVVEWQDIIQHPLDDGGAEDDEGELEQPYYATPIENNYFATHFTDEGGASSANLYQRSNSGGGSSNSADRLENSFSSNSRSNPLASSSSSSLSQQIMGSAAASPSPQLGGAGAGNPGEDNLCQVVKLNDVDRIDTTLLKCNTIKILENKWPALVKHMKTLIVTHRSIAYSENCILSFLALWENIISVKANLSIVETLPFYAQLDKFMLLLNQQDLSITIYRKMLTLFNEALCYGSTLALQDCLPEETCNLAHQVVRNVKDYNILESLPRRRYENPVTLIGCVGATVTLRQDSFRMCNAITEDQEETIDKTLLQKMVLLVLKSVAVTVKEIRSDSSDSSIDTTDYDAFQDMVLIERSIRDVLKKLETYIKSTRDFLPSCHFSEILIHLFDDQDDYLIEAMVCTLDVTVGLSFRNDAFPELVSMLNPVYTFLEFLKMISYSWDLLLDLLISNETCFLLYLLRFLKYIRQNWAMFKSSCQNMSTGNMDMLDTAMDVLKELRLKISQLVSHSLYPYDISPVLRLLESCESLKDGDELS